ncbi:manganese transport system substrate-binding protein [Dulcicalothrix desertica PCC 7102]|nr:manganese transport system substrate-binding protein [Dulcicalothrix desertica PCC 7102]
MNQLKSPACIILSMLLLTTVFGCTSSQNPSDNSSQAQISPSARTDGKKKVLTTFTILADMARNVAGDKLVVESITRPGAEIHDYEPTPSDIKRAQEADLVLFNGLGLERWFEKFMGSVRNVTSANLSDGVKPIEISSGSYLNKPNPHAWMSPNDAAIYVENIRKAFVKLDPANEATYNANAKAYIQQVKQVSQEVKTQLATLAPTQRYLVTCEGAFSYMARDYGLQEAYLWAVNSEQEGTPQQIAKVIDTVRQNKIPAVFCETTVSDEAQRQVARESNSTFAGVLYVDSLSEVGKPAATFLDLQRYNAYTLVQGLLGKSK